MGCASCTNADKILSKQASEEKFEKEQPKQRGDNVVHLHKKKLTEGTLPDDMTQMNSNWVDQESKSEKMNSDIQIENEGNTKLILKVQEDNKKEEEHIQIWKSKDQIQENFEDIQFNTNAKFKKPSTGSQQTIEKFRQDQESPQKSNLEQLGIKPINEKQRLKLTSLEKIQQASNSSLNSPCQPEQVVNFQQNKTETKIDPILQQQKNSARDNQNIARIKPQIPAQMNFDFLEENQQNEGKKNLENINDLLKDVDSALVSR